MQNKPHIMDVTLRDGSYAIDFQFTEHETEDICRSLNQSGIRYIEVGHGMGIDASIRNGRAACTDEAYLKAACKGAGKSKFGMFCIPGIAQIDSLSKMAEMGASFVRIGTNVDDVEKSKSFIKEAKRLGLEVMANYMKSYTATPEMFAEKVKMSEEYGADVVYIVDSAGSMDQSDIEKYYIAIKNASSLKIGFHGHNNLGLGVSNSLYAYNLGVDFIDTSIGGMGRSAGNAATELLVANIIKRYDDNQYDLKRILECGELYVKPLWKRGTSVLDVYCGLAEFHTSYMQYIRDVSLKYKVNPLELIMEYSKYDKVNMDEDKLDEIARNMDKADSSMMIDFGFDTYFGNEQKIGDDR